MEMVDRKKIGKIQFYFGILLLLATIVSSFFILNDISSIRHSYAESTMDVWNSLYEQHEGDIPDLFHLETAGQGTEHAILHVNIGKAIMYIYGMGSFLTVVLSIMLILQGLANQSKK